MIPRKHAITSKTFTIVVFDVVAQVHFLDHARRQRFIPAQLCLFQVKSEFKESTQLIAAFSKEYLRGEGDILRHLAMLKYKVTRTFFNKLPDVLPLFSFPEHASTL